VISEHDGVGLFAGRRLPLFIKVVDRHRAATSLKRLVECRPGVDPLGFGVDVGEATLMLAAAFVTRWCAGSSVKIRKVFRVREDRPAQRNVAASHKTFGEGPREPTDAYIAESLTPNRCIHRSATRRLGMKEIRIRAATGADVKAISEIVDQAYQHYISRIGMPLGPMLDDYAARVAKGTVWVLEEAEAIAALVVLRPAPDYLPLDNIAVTPGAPGLRVRPSVARLRGGRGTAAWLSRDPALHSPNDG
jgi:hypothetical protein